MRGDFLCTRTEPVVETSAGKLRGYRYNGVYIFRGVRYAEARRFMPPRPVKPWEGIRDALNYGPVAPLIRHPAPDIELLIPHRSWPEAEDCLYLNVWSKSIDRSAKRPVLVWLHGGGFFAGSSIEQEAYDGANLSGYGDAVVVSLNHRLNVLGYLDLSAYGDQYANSCNAGMEDVIEALRWVRENIEGFGGNKDNVTVFGQSGGGMKIGCLEQMPEAEGLFHRAVIMSGVADGAPAQYGDASAAKALLRELGLGENQAEKLESVPFSALAAACVGAEERLGKAIDWAPAANGWYDGDPVRVGFSRFAKTIPTIAGTTVSEAGIREAAIPDMDKLDRKERLEALRSMYGDSASDVMNAFSLAYPGRNEAEALRLDKRFRGPTLRYLEAKAAVTKAPLYAYVFAPEFSFDGGTPAWHCSDIPFFFRNTALVPAVNIPGVTPELENGMSNALLAFAETGDPNNRLLPAWPRYSGHSGPEMIFDRQCAVRAGHDEKLQKLIRASSGTMARTKDAASGAWVY